MTTGIKKQSAKPMRAKPSAALSKRRRENLAEIRNGVTEMERRSVEVIRSRLKEAQDKSQDVVLTGYEAELLLKALGKPEKKRGAPDHFSYFHHHLAIHYLWLVGRGTPSKRAYGIVGDEWEITRSAIAAAVKFLKNNKRASTHADGFMSVHKDEEDMRKHLEQTSSAFRTLGHFSIDEAKQKMQKAISSFAKLIDE